MSSELRRYLAGTGQVLFPNTLLRWYEQGKESRFHKVDPSAPFADHNFQDPTVDSSFPAQLRDACNSGVLAPGCTVFVTARTAIPCADAVRGFAEEKKIENLSYEYIVPRMDPREEARIAEIFRTNRPGSTLIIDQFTTGDTIVAATKMVLESLQLADTSPQEVPIGVVPGSWYSMIVPSKVRNAFSASYTQHDGGNYVDYDHVTLPELSETMNRAGHIAAKLLGLDPMSKHAMRDHIENMLYSGIRIHR